MKVAVSGAAGFVGRHVVAELTRRGVPAALLTRSPEALSTRDGKHRIVACDLSSPPADLHERCGRPEVLLHLAWGGLPNYRANHHFESELPAQYRFLKQWVQAGLAQVLAVGTCLEYGLECGALSEDREPRPLNPYALAKDALRRQLGFLKTEQAFGLTWARLFYMHGEGQAASSLWPQLQAAVERGEARFAMSAGEQLRDYLPVTDVARHLVDLALAGREHGIVNVCSGQPISVRALVEGWIAKHGWSITPELGRYPYPDYEPLAFWGDRSKLDRCLAEAASPSQSPMNR